MTKLAPTSTQMINDAINERPDMVQTRLDLTNRDITKKSTRNALLPTTDFIAVLRKLGHRRQRHLSEHLRPTGGPGTTELRR